MDRITLCGQEASHAVRSRRLRAGDQLALFNGAGDEIDCVIVDLAGRDQLTLDVTSRRAVPKPPAASLTVAVAVGKPNRQVWLVEKLTELGVGAIWPIDFARSTATVSHGTATRWQRRAIEAAKQSGQAWLPQIIASTSLTDLLRDVPRFGCALCAHPTPDTRPLLASLENADFASGVIVIIGPEGGMTDGEVAEAAAAGCVPVRLGQTTLRLETAAVAVASAIVGWLDVGVG